MRPIDADELRKRAIEKLHITNSLNDVTDLIDSAPTIVPSGNTKSCGVSADKSADQNVADVPSGDLISRADAIELLTKIVFDEPPYFDSETLCRIYAEEQINALPSADRPTIKQTDTLIIADALRYLVQDTERHESDRTRAEELRKQILQYGASMCLSAEPSGDLISRAEVLALINKAMDTTDNKDIQDYIFCGLRRDVHNLPSADRQTDESCQNCPIYSAEEKNCPRFNKVIPQTREEMNRPKGEWVEDFNFVHRAWRCSKCFAITSTKTPFCHECGADMRGEKDD